VAADARAAYARYEFHTVARRLLDFVTTDLSAFWCDVKKDALYVLSTDDPVRRSAQTTAFRLVEVLALVLQPICPFTAEEIWESLPGRAGDSPALATWDSLRLSRLDVGVEAAWSRLLEVRAEVQRLLEPLRRDGAIGSSAQAAVEIGPSDALDADLAVAGLDPARLAELLIVPEVVRAGGATVQEALYGGLALAARPAVGVKCPRCWQVRRDGGADGLCGRCQGVLALA
jgi:isoleucyl-tRNA synthetase